MMHCSLKSIWSNLKLFCNDNKEPLIIILFFSKVILLDSLKFSKISEESNNKFFFTGTISLLLDHHN